MNIDEDELVRKFIFEVGRTPSLLTLALNFVFKYELDEIIKVNINKLLIKHNPFSNYDFNFHESAHNLLNQYFSMETEEMLTNWQITVTLLEIKNLIGVNEKVFCLVEIGDKKFYTREKHIDRLQFNEEDNEEEKFIARIENVSLKRAFNSKIAISVYFKSFYPFAHTLVGKFQTDFGTVYDQPGHSIYRQWGEIKSPTLETKEIPVKLDEEKELEASNENADMDFMLNELALHLKGYVKFDISLRTDSDINKVFVEDFNKGEDSEDIEK